VYYLEIKTAALLRKWRHYIVTLYLKTSRDARIVVRISTSMKLYSCTVTDAIHANLSTRSSKIAK